MSEEKNTFKVVILFLAHEGVTQPKWWEYWRRLSSTNRHNIIFKVHAPSNPKYGKNFCIDNSVGFYDHSTEWCQPNLVMVYLELIKAVSLEYSNSIIYLVSGYDVPVCSPDLMFNETLKTLFGTKPFNPMASKICYFPNGMATQWLAVSSTNAVYMYDYLVTKGNFYRYAKEYYHKAKTGIGFEFTNGCPDETFVTHAVKDTFNFFGTYRKGKACTTFDVRPTDLAPSPVLWTSFSKPQPHQNIYNIPGIACVNGTLRNFIYYVRMTQNIEDLNFFIRKVGPTVVFDEEMKQTLSMTTHYIYDHFRAKYGDVLRDSSNFIKSHLLSVVTCPDVSSSHRRLAKKEEFVKQFETFNDFLYYFRPRIQVTKLISPRVNSYIQSLISFNPIETMIGRFGRAT